jgi:hypothetical protein
MDGHAVPQDGYVAACLALLDEVDAWNVGGAIRKTSRSPRGAAIAAATSSPFGIGGGDRFHTRTSAGEVDTLWPGCWPRWVFEQVGLFDPEMHRNQDDEHNRRITDRGGRIWLDPTITIEYEPRPDYRGLWRQYFGYGLYKVRGVQKRPRLFRLRHAVPAATVLWLTISPLVAMGDRRFGIAWATSVVAWLAAAFLFADRVSARFGARRTDVVMAFACLHSSYGLGMLAGVIRFAPRWLVRRRGHVPVLEQVVPDPE